MEREEVLSVLKQLEQKYPVDKWKIDTIDVWPIVKLNIFDRWRNTQEEQYNKLLKSVASKPSSIKNLFRYFASFYYLLSLFVKKKKSIPFLFSGANSHRINFEGEFINRYYAPLMAHLTEIGHESLIIEYHPRDISKQYPSVDSIVFLNNYLPAVKFLGLFKNKKNIIELDQFDDFIDDINRHIPALKLKKTYVNALLNKVKAISNYKAVYSIFIKKYNPKYAVCLCYYSDPCFGMMSAAKENNVIGIDMQHGGQGAMHPSYSDFCKVPANGFNLLPQLFWCWDQSSYNNINAWASKQIFHKPIIGGNPWLGYFATKNYTVYAEAQEKIILYTLQLNEPEQFIIQAIKNTPPGYKWWLRLHPRTLNTLPHIKSVLSNAGVLDKLEIDKATSYPLPQILSNTSVHISAFSGAVIEAALFGIKTIIIDPIGVGSYADYIKLGLAVPDLSKDPDKLLSLILTNEANSKIADNLNLYKKVIDDLLTDSKR
jgi:hypothetical protein